jgi:hypothetical protein
MNKKILIALLMTGLTLQGCTKQEAATAETTQKVKEETPTSGIPISDLGRKDIESNGAKELQKMLDGEFPNTYTVASTDQVKFLHKEDNGYYTYQWNIRFKENSTGNLLGCDGSEVSWDNENTQISPTLKGDCFTVIEEAQNQAQAIPETAPVKIALERNPSHDFMSKVRVQAVVDQVTVYNVTLNRGNCPLYENLNPEAPKKIGFGNSLVVDAKCNKDNIIEVVVSTDQGDWTFNS